MCGIIGYVGGRDSTSTLIDGLVALEYRGYDSAGIAQIFSEKENKILRITKTSGRVRALIAHIKQGSDNGNSHIGIGHTRWATHGAPTTLNAHPHKDCSGTVCVVHNGVIENYRSLRDALIARGHVFISETDTEVLPHLIEEARATGESLDHAVATVLKKIRGAYAIAVIDTQFPDAIVVARHFSPLVIGVGDTENLIASDITPILRHTRTVVHLEDGDIATVTANSYRIVRAATAESVARPRATVEWNVSDVTKNTYAHFMHKEIHEQSEAVENSLRGRMVLADGSVKLGGLDAVRNALRAASRIIFVACGTAYHAALIGKQMVEAYVGIPAVAEVASEFRYRSFPLGSNDVVVAISQSGETADTIAAVREAKRRGAVTIGIVNTVGATLARETDAGIYQRVGPEIAVASTKAFTSQITILALFTVMLGRDRSLSLTNGKRIIDALHTLPDCIARAIAQTEKEAIAFASRYATSEHMFFMGRMYQHAIALEGALKMKEVSYIHAEGYGSGELKHGSLAMISKSIPSIFIVPDDDVREKNISNMHEVRARGGPVIAIATEGDGAIQSSADHVLYVPRTIDMLTPLLTTVAVQLLAYHVGVARGCDIDKPRNLAKSVTVE